MAGMMSKAMAREAGQPEPEQAPPEAPPEQEPEQKPARRRSGPEGPTEGELEPNATPDEQAEYDRAAQALYTFLYERDQMTDSIAGQLVDGEQKVGSVAQAGLLILKNLDEQIDMDETVIASITEDLVGELIEIGESKGLSYSDDEKKQALATTWEGTQVLFGGESSIEDDLAGITTGMSKQELQEASNFAQELLKKGAGAGVPGTMDPGGVDEGEAENG